MYLMLGKNISSTCKIRYVRYIAPSYGGSIRGTDGIAHHVPARSPLNLRPSGPAVHAQMRPPWAAHGHVATLSHATRVLQTTLQIDVKRLTAARKPQRHLVISKLLRHRFARPTQGSGPDAQETAWSKLPGSGHDIRPGECARGGTRWPTAHRLSEHRPTHARALLTAC